MRKNQNSLKENNKGFTLASLLVIMLLASVLAALLLTVTVLNVQSKQIDRKSKDTFYLAESIVDEIQAGIESELGEAIGVAYREALPKFKSDMMKEVKAEYATKIISTLFTKYTGKPYTDTYNNSFPYDYTVLKSYLSDKNKANIDKVELICGNLYVDKTNSKLTLKDLEIKYYTKDGYLSSMQMDFVVKVPDVSFDNPGFYLSLGDYAIITDDKLTSKSPKADINGSVYAGAGIESQGDNKVINFISDNIVTRKAITSDAGGTININGKDEVSKVWADTIETTNKDPNSTLLTSIIIKNAKCYVKNDLVLDARNNNYVSITGDYYGFGYSLDNANESSAILINGRKSTLDLTGISSMLLAGRAYIDADPNDKNKGVLMGESLSVKGNQIAYLVPAEYVKGGSNPTTQKIDDKSDDLEVDFRPSDSRDFTNKKSYKTYIDTYQDTYKDKAKEEAENGSILQYLNLNRTEVGYKKVMVNSETYYYLEFRSEKLANKYFSNYYKENKDRIDERTRLYVDSIKLDNNLDLYTIVGNLTAYDKSTKEADVIYQDEPDNVTATSNLYSNQYKNMIYNLYESGSASGAEENNSLFEKYINTSVLLNLPKSVPEVFELDSNTKAVFVNNENGDNFSIKSQFTGGSASGIIVANGIVEVDRDFNGTIIAKGGIVFNNGNRKLTADKLTVYQLLNPSYPDVTKYFKELSSRLANESNKTGQNINIHELVDIENWKKK
ncbi:hypothetical protein [Anaerosporobacter sp.]